MADLAYLQLINRGVKRWNQWRQNNASKRPDLSGANLEELNLAGINLVGVNLSGANLKYANLKGAHLRFALLDEADLSYADLSESDLGSALLIQSNLRHACLVKADFCRANLRGANLEGVQGDQTFLIEANLIQANLSRSNLTKAILTEANLQSVNLSYANLTKSDLSFVILSNANLAHANLSKVICLEGQVNDADLTGSNLYCANFQRANFQNSSLHSANMSGGNFGESNFKDADLRGANLKDIRVMNANLYAAKLHDVVEDFAVEQPAMLSEKDNLVEQLPLPATDIVLDGVANPTFTNVQFSLSVSDPSPAVNSQPAALGAEFSAPVEKLEQKIPEGEQIFPFSTVNVDIYLPFSIDWVALASALQRCKDIGCGLLNTNCIEVKTDQRILLRLELDGNANTTSVLKILMQEYEQLQSKETQVLQETNTHQKSTLELLNLHLIEHPLDRLFGLLVASRR
ncbi:MAG TPA: pentapeptide repeat-containing protein [Stenomitos sp.]